jgi:rhodanese-related sulfurtransferase
MSIIRVIALAVMASGLCLAQSPSGTSFQGMVQEAKSRIKEASTSQLKEWMDSGQKLILIDVREDSEWQAGHAASAAHVGRGILERGIETAAPDKAQRIVLYCHSGARSALAADTLQKMGYTNVFSLAGGYVSYQAAGLPSQK